MKKLKRDKYEDENWFSNANAPRVKAFSRIIMIAGSGNAVNMLMLYLLRGDENPAFYGKVCLGMAFAGLLISWNRATSQHKSHRDTTGVIDAVGMLTFLTGFMAVECHELFLLIPLFIELMSVSGFMRVRYGRMVSTGLKSTKNNTYRDALRQ